MPVKESSSVNARHGSQARGSQTRDDGQDRATSPIEGTGQIALAVARDAGRLAAVPARLALRVAAPGLSLGQRVAGFAFRTFSDTVGRDSERPAERADAETVGRGGAGNPPSARERADGPASEPKPARPARTSPKRKPGVTQQAQASPVAERPKAKPRRKPERSVAPAPPPPHVSEEPVLAHAVAERGAEDGAGAEVTVAQPWEGYDSLSARDVVDRLSGASSELAAAVRLYESSRRGRATVLAAADRALASRPASG